MMTLFPLMRQDLADQPAEMNSQFLQQKDSKNAGEIFGDVHQAFNEKSKSPGRLPGLFQAKA